MKPTNQKNIKTKNNFNNKMTLYNSLKTTAKAAIVITAGIMAYYAGNYLRDKPMESRCDDFEAQFEKSPKDIVELSMMIIKENGWQYAIASKKAKKRFDEQRQKANKIILAERIKD